MGGSMEVQRSVNSGGHSINKRKIALARKHFKQAVKSRMNLKSEDEVKNIRLDWVWGNESRELAWRLLNKINKKAPDYIRFEG